jgi:hypothetical protein
MGSIRYYRNDFFITPQVPSAFKNNPVEYTVNFRSFRSLLFSITMPTLVGLGICYIGLAWVHDDQRWFVLAFGAIFVGSGLQQLLYLKNRLTVNRTSLRFDTAWNSKLFNFGDFDKVELRYFHYQSLGNSNDVLKVELHFFLNEKNTYADLIDYPNAARHSLAIIKYFYPDKMYHMEWNDMRHNSRSVMNLQDGSVSID